MKLKPFSDELPIPKYAVPKEKHKCFTYYEIGMKEFYHQFHKDLKPTKIWGYNGQLPDPLVNADRSECTHYKPDDCGYGCGKKHIAGKRRQKEKSKKNPHHSKPCHEQKKKCPKCSKTYRCECE